MLKKSAVICCVILLIMTFFSVPAMAETVTDDLTASVYFRDTGVNGFVLLGEAVNGTSDFYSKTVTSASAGSTIPNFHLEIKGNKGQILCRAGREFIFEMNNFNCMIYSPTNNFELTLYETHLHYADGSVSVVYNTGMTFSYNSNGSYFKAVYTPTKDLKEIYVKLHFRATSSASSDVYTMVGFHMNNFTMKFTEESDSSAVLKEQMGEIKGSIEENTDKINDKMEELQDNEKTEANSQGNASADELASAIPDKSQGFINGMSSLISAMSYDGTEAKWTFPQLYIPEIPGVIGRTQLTSEEYEIDFGFWVQKLPENILSIVRIVLTIGLILYCFKELYGTISYVLTLKKDGGGE